MADGLSAYLANAWVNTIRGGGNGTSYTAPAAIDATLHTADPGSAGTTAASAGSTASVAVTSGAASGGASALSNSPQWTNGGTSETITDMAFTDGTNFLYSGQLTSSKPWNSTDTLTLTSLAFSLGPMAS